MHTYLNFCSRPPITLLEANPNERFPPAPTPECVDWQTQLTRKRAMNTYKFTHKVAKTGDKLDSHIGPNSKFLFVFNFSSLRLFLQTSFQPHLNVILSCRGLSKLVCTLSVMCKLNILQCSAQMQRFQNFNYHIYL